jgi:hypothetical protein
MRIRQDPVAAAAEAIAMIERRCGGGSYAEAADVADFTPEENLVCTVGSLSLWPGASNVIAGSANFTVDVRCVGAVCPSASAEMSTCSRSCSVYLYLRTPVLNPFRTSHRRENKNGGHRLQ